MKTPEYDVDVCYKCEANEVCVPVGTVHPLCNVCQEEFDSWFTKSLTDLINN